MDIISTFVALIFFGFFASNYFYKYKEEATRKDYIELFVYIGFILELSISLNFFMGNKILLLISSFLLVILLIIEFIFGLIKISKLSKKGEINNNFIIIILGIRNCFYILGAPFLIIQQVMYLIYNMFVSKE
jgi:hypothetical protein